MALHDDPAIIRVRAGESMLVPSPGQNLSMGEVHRAAVYSTGPTYPGDAGLALFACLAGSGAVISTWPPREEITGSVWPYVLVYAAVNLAITFVFFVLVPMGRGVSARATLASLDLSEAVEVDMAEAEAIAAATGPFHRQWGRESVARAQHLEESWRLATTERLFVGA